MGARGTAVVDFGAFPGSPTASVAVIGQAGTTAGSAAEAWARPVDTALHSADEHIIEDLKVTAGAIQAGVGFPIECECKSGRLYGTYNLNWCWDET